MVGPMRIVTWNVNSLKARWDRVEEWIGLHAPDVLCLQETKLADSAFPAAAFGTLGYEAAHHGDGRWNGVAIISRVGLADVRAGFHEGIEPDSDTRLLWATCGGVRVASAYVPNGREVGADHFRYKLSWLARLRDDLEANADPADPVVVVGDFNVAPDDRDVWDPAMFVGATHVTPEERAALQGVEAWGLVDVFRHHHDEGGVFSWWDYRGGAFHKKEGMRIDLILATSSLVARSREIFIDREARKGTKPSDHAPVVWDVDV
jgi:exodeoxyribonuclease-3